MLGFGIIAAFLFIFQAFCLGLFVLWFIQFVRPGWHVPVTAAYLAWALLELALLLTGRRKWIAFSAFLREWRRHSVPRPRRA